MKQTLQLRLGQHLTMTPQLQQAIRLLQLSALDLSQEIQEVLETNPLLDVEDEFSHNNHKEERDAADDRFQDQQRKEAPEGNDVNNEREIQTDSVITSYSIHYTKLYDPHRGLDRSSQFPVYRK